MSNTWLAKCALISPLSSVNSASNHRGTCLLSMFFIVGTVTYFDAYSCVFRSPFFFFFGIHLITKVYRMYGSFRLCLHFVRKNNRTMLWTAVRHIYIYRYRYMLCVSTFVGFNFKAFNFLTCIDWVYITLYIKSIQTRSYRPSRID